MQIIFTIREKEDKTPLADMCVNLEQFKYMFGYAFVELILNQRDFTELILSKREYAVAWFSLNTYHLCEILGPLPPTCCYV